MNIPQDLRYTKEHEWLRLEGDMATIGITDFAQDQLGDIVYLELPEVGESLEKEKTFGVVESTKSVSDLFAPISGEVLETNESLIDSPETINESPYEEGWMIKLKISDPTQLEDLLKSSAYQDLIKAS
ncbi:MAG: glycine cleavage system protein GcvH [Deltaproteobacteria bacterium]|nr:glycine cleavage system protein GcvH [Deltaproteobacteria bacterium]